MPGTAKEKVAAANARAVDDRLTANSSTANASTHSGSRLNVPSSSSSALSSAPSSPEVDASSSKADGKKKKGITSRLKRFFTPWNRSNSKIEGEDNVSNGIKSTKSNSDTVQVNQCETQGSLSENRSMSHECVFNGDQISPINPTPTHHKSMEVLSGGFAADLNKKIQLGRPPPKTPAKKVTAVEDEQPRSMQERSSDGTEDSAAVEQNFFQPWSTTTPVVSQSDDSSAPDMNSFGTVDSASLIAATQKSRLNVRQKNRRPVTVVGGQRLRTKLDTVLVMPSTLTEESDADDVSGPNTATSVPASADVRPHRFQKKGDSKTGKELHSPTDSSGQAPADAECVDTAKAATVAPISSLHTGSAAGEESLRPQLLTVDVSAQPVARGLSSPASPLVSPTGSLVSPATEKSPSLTSQVSPGIKIIEGSIISPNHIFSENLTCSTEQLNIIKTEEQSVKGPKPPTTKPKPPITAAKPLVTTPISAAATTPDGQGSMKDGVSVCSAVPASGMSSSQVSVPDVEVSKSLIDATPFTAAQSSIIIPRVSLSKQISQTVTSAPESDVGTVSKSNVDPAPTTFTLPRVRHPNNNTTAARPDVLLLKVEPESGGTSAASPIDESTGFKPSSIVRTKKGTSPVVAKQEIGGNEISEDVTASGKNSQIQNAGVAVKRRTMAAVPSSLQVTANKRQSYQEKDSSDVSQAADDAKAGSELSLAFKRLQQNKDTKPPVPAAEVCADGTIDTAKHISSSCETSTEQKFKTSGSIERSDVELGKQSAEVAGQDSNESSDHNQPKDLGSHETSIEHKQPKTSGNETAMEQVGPSADQARKNNSFQAPDKLAVSKLPDKEVSSTKPLISSGPKSFRTAPPPKPSGLASRGNTLGQTWSPGDVVGSKGKEPVNKEALSVPRKVLLSDDVVAGRGSSENLSLPSADSAAKNMSSNLNGAEQTSKFSLGVRRGGGGGVREDEVSAAGQREPTKVDSGGDKTVLVTRPVMASGAGSLRRADGAVAIKELEKMSIAEVSNVDTHKSVIDVKTDTETKKTDEQGLDPRTMFGERSKSVLLKNGSLKKNEGAAMAKVLATASKDDGDSSKNVGGKVTASEKTTPTEATKADGIEQVANARTMFGERTKVMGSSLKKSEASFATKMLMETSDAAKTESDSKPGVLKADVELSSRASLPASKALDPPKAGTSLSLRRSDGTTIAKALNSMTASSVTLAADKDADNKVPTKPIIRGGSAKVTSSTELSLSANKPSWIANVQSKKANWSKLTDKAEESSSSPDNSGTPTVPAT